jgi:LmbE family N-acetylglucosaminyl deacetylase
VSILGEGAVLFVSPHTDDAELGCGGTIARTLEEGTEVHVLVFSSAEESRPPGTPPTILKDEFLLAMAALGVPSSNLQIEGFPVRHLSAHRQEVLEELIRVRARVQPSVVFAPASTDVHQDHQVVHAECLRAFKDLTVWGYELPWNHVGFDANAFVRLERRHLDAKWKALQLYKTQFELGRPYFSWEFIEALARVRGTQVNVPYAEAFEVERIRV